MHDKFDLVVIGSGTAGSTVAFQCRAAGWSVAIIDSLPFGGTCALRGCDPNVRQYDQAVEVCKKLAKEDPTFAPAHRLCLAPAYWGKRMYPQVIEEFRAYGQLSGNRNDSDFASAVGEGFRSGGWKGALSTSVDDAI